MSNKSGAILIVSLILTYSILTLSYIGAIRSVTELKAAELYETSVSAFHVADGGIDAAIVNLQDSAAGLWNSCDTGYDNSLGGEYTIKCPDSNLRKITSFGDNGSVTRVVEVYGARIPPDDFYGNAIYATNGIELNGNSYLVVGDVVTSDVGVIDNAENVQGDVLQDASYGPVPELDFELLKQIAISQGHYYDSWTIQSAVLPETFWYAPGIPNVVYIEDAGITLRGNDIVGGFIVIADETVEYPLTMSGNATVEGIVYTRGNFDVDGGGQSLNINGGVFSGNLTVLNGGIEITTNTEYHDAIRNLNITTTFNILLWRELRGDPKTWYDQNGNRCHSSEQDCAIELSDWDMIAYGVTSESDRFVTYRNPDNEWKVVQVFYDPTLDGDQVTNVMMYEYSPIDGSRTEEDGSNVYVASETYAGAGGL